MKKLLCLLTILVATFTAAAQGSVPAMLDYVGSSPTNSGPVYSKISSGNPMTLGWTFQPTADISVTALGAFSYVLQNPGNLEIGLWDSGGALLASNSVSVTSTSDETVYQSITPLLLFAGQTYYLGAYSFAPLYFYVVGPDSESHGSATLSPGLQLTGLAYNTNSFFAFPSTMEGSAGDAVVAPNFQFEVVPEPSTFCLLGGGVIIFLIMRRRSKSLASV